VVGIVEAAEGMRQGVNGAEPALEGGGAHGGGHEHVAARIEVLRSVDGGRQVLLHQPQPLDRDPLRQRVVGRRAIGLEAVGKRVHARRRGELGRQADGEPGVEEGELRHHLRVKDDLLLVRLGMGDDAGPADLGAGPGGGRHRDDGRDGVGVGPRPPVADVLEVEDRPGLAVHEGDELADVERRAAAEGDHAVVVAVLEGRHPVGDILLDRIGRTSANSPTPSAPPLEVGKDGLDHRHGGKPGVGDQHGRSMPASRHSCASSAMRPAPKRMAVGKLMLAVTVIPEVSEGSGRLGAQVPGLGPGQRLVADCDRVQPRPCP
jgi:hypothetical protein